MKNTDKDPQEKVPRSIKGINIIAILFVITSCIYIYYNYKHMIATAGGEWGPALAPFYAIPIALFNAFIVFCLFLSLRKICPHIKTQSLTKEKGCPR